MASDSSYVLEKAVWTTDDFEQMGWHDCHIHAVAFQSAGHRLLLDVDYIYRWVNPLPGETYFRFWISPCTLVFENVHDFNFEAADTWIDILHVDRQDAGRPLNADHIGKEKQWQWIFECVAGEICFKSVGFTQYTRAAPTLFESQHIELESRGGISFSTEAVVLPAL